MPTYEFTCPEGHDFDKFFRSMASAPTVVPCPVCGKPADRQMSAGAGLVFHGTGFYITDYGKDGKKDQKSAGRRVESKSSDGGESRSDHSGESGDSGKSSASGDAGQSGQSGEASSRTTEARTDSGSAGSSGSDSKSSDVSPVPKPSATPPAKPKASE